MPQGSYNTTFNFFLLPITSWPLLPVPFPWPTIWIFAFLLFYFLFHFLPHVPTCVTRITLWLQEQSLSWSQVHVSSSVHPPWASGPCRQLLHRHVNPTCQKLTTPESVPFVGCFILMTKSPRVKSASHSRFLLLPHSSHPISFTISLIRVLQAHSQHSFHSHGWDLAQPKPVFKAMH